MSSEDLNLTIPSGAVLVIETGEYSDKQWHGPVRAVKQFTKREVSVAYRKSWAASEDDDFSFGPSPDGFLPWLVKEGYVEDIDGVIAWHVGSYSDFEP